MREKAQAFRSLTEVQAFEGVIDVKHGFYARLSNHNLEHFKAFVSYAGPLV